MHIAVAAVAAVVLVAAAAAVALQQRYIQHLCLDRIATLY